MNTDHANIESDDPYSGLWLVPKLNEPLKFELWQAWEHGSDPCDVTMDAAKYFRDNFSEKEAVIPKSSLAQWATALRQLATEIDAALERGHFLEGTELTA